MWALGAFELRRGDEASAAPEDAEQLVELVYRARTRSSLSVDRLEVGEASHRFLGADELERLWLDVEAFENAGRRGLSRQGTDPRDLAEAAGLYRGEFLEGVVLAEGSTLASWLDDQRRRLRGLALEVLDALVASYMSRGEVRLGTRWAHRLVALDPLREEGHRYLIRLYGDTGRRRQARAQFEELRRLLAERLGCAPSKETRRVLAEALEVREASDVFFWEPVGPVLPLVERGDSYHQLEADWSRAAAGCHLSLVAGEAGVGKTRLVRTVLDGLSARRSVPILLGRCDGLVQQSFRVVRELIEAGLVSAPELGQTLRDQLDPAAYFDASRVVPGLRPENPASDPIDDSGSLPTPGPVDRERLFEALAEALEWVARARHEASSRGEPAATESAGLTDAPTLVLFLDDLHFAEGETWDLVRHLLARPADHRWWIVATCPTTACEAFHQNLSPGLAQRVTRIELERVSGAAVEEIARALVEGEEVPVLHDFLARRGLGLPVALAEWVNYLWDDRALLQERDHWRLEKPVEGLQAPPDESLEGLIWRRFQRLPSSARRLAVLASVIGHQVDHKLLMAIEEEHRTVIELGLQLLVERWVLQRRSRHWSTSRGEADSETQPTYEFSHRRIRQAIYHSLVPNRRRALHGTVARMLVARHRGHEAAQSEVLAHHFRAAGAWSDAYPYLRRSARKAAALLARDTAVHYFERTLEAIDRGLESGGDRERWQRRRRHVEDERRAFETAIAQRSRI